MFVGVAHIIREKTMKEKIENMMEIDKLKLVNTRLGNMSVNQLF